MTMTMQLVLIINSVSEARPRNNYMWGRANDLVIRWYLGTKETFTTNKPFLFQGNKTSHVDNFELL